MGARNNRCPAKRKSEGASSPFLTVHHSQRASYHCLHPPTAKAPEDTCTL